MSHFTKLKTSLKDLTALKKAISDAGFTCKAGPTSIIGWSGQSRKVELAVSVANDTYNIGFCRNANNELELIADWSIIYGMKPAVFLEKIKQPYAYHCARAQLESQGFQLESELRAAEGAIKLVLRRSV